MSRSYGVREELREIIVVSMRTAGPRFKRTIATRQNINFRDVARPALGTFIRVQYIYHLSLRQCNVIHCNDVESTINPLMAKWNRVKGEVWPLKFRKFRAISLMRASAVIREIPSILNSRFNHTPTRRQQHHHRPLHSLSLTLLPGFSSLASLPIVIGRSRIFRKRTNRETRYR